MEMFLNWSSELEIWR